MSDKPKILFVGDYCRTDYLRLLDKSKDCCDFWFLYLDTPAQEQNRNYQQYGHAIYWSDYENAQHLLNSILPHKVIFLYLDSYKALVLNISCRNAGIYTYHLEHGMRADYAIGHDITISSYLHRQPLQKIRYLVNLIWNLRTRLKSRQFLKSSISKLSAEDASFAKEFISIRSKNNYFDTFKLLPSPKRIADCYISFSPKVYRVHQQYDHLLDSQPVHFIGIPYFDRLANVKSMFQERAILFIDQPLAEHRLLQWTAASKKEFTAKLSYIAQRYQYKIYVKPHPRQDNSLWQQANNIKFIDDNYLLKICGRIPIIIGFYSTYLIPFAAFTHTTLLTLENHPVGKIDVSKSFIDAGVAHPIYHLEKDLPWALEHIEELHQKQVPNKAKFTEDWLYKFDGKAGERLRDILLSDEL